MYHEITTPIWKGNLCQLKRDTVTLYQIQHTTWVCYDNKRRIIRDVRDRHDTVTACKLLSKYETCWAGVEQAI